MILRQMDEPIKVFGIQSTDTNNQFVRIKRRKKKYKEQIFAQVTVAIRRHLQTSSTHMIQLTVDQFAFETVFSLLHFENQRSWTVPTIPTHLPKKNQKNNWLVVIFCFLCIPARSLSFSQILSITCVYCCRYIFFSSCTTTNCENLSQMHTHTREVFHC